MRKWSILTAALLVGGCSDEANNAPNKPTPQLSDLGFVSNDTAGSYPGSNEDSAPAATSDGGSPAADGATAGAADAAPAAADAGKAAADGANSPPPKGSGDAGATAGQPPGGACKSLCDCQQGLACAGGTCVAVTPPRYCCDKPGCPLKSFCFKASGLFGFCATATNPPPCASACDCPAGEYCNKGTCQKAGVPIYCCTGKCPQGSVCQELSGAFAICQGTTQGPCVSDADCQKGGRCFFGTCFPKSP